MKKRFEVAVHLPDKCKCTNQQISDGRSFDLCFSSGRTPSVVYVTLSAYSSKEAREFIRERFPEGKIVVRKL